MLSHVDPSPLREARKILFLLALTGGLGGLQGVFSVQTAMGSPYLMSLGFSKTLIPFVWLAGPLAGVIGQPYFGLCSDQCRIRWGRRKTFIAGGALAIILSLPALAWAGELVHTAAWVLGVRQDRHALQTITMVAAAVLIWVLNFAIQPLQCGLRALIVEACPPGQVDAANAWASRMVSVGSLLGYGSGFVDLSRLLGIGGGHAQFKVLSVLATCGLALTVFVCCCAVRERDPNEDGPPCRNLESLMGKARHIYGSIFNIPPQVAMVCKVQLFSWAGWFSFMYYITTYIGEIYLQNIHPVSLAVQKTANQHGSLALLMFASAQLLASIIAPYLITKPDHSPRPIPDALDTGRRTHTALPRFLSRHLNLSTPWSSLCALWMLSHAIFAACMFSTLLVGNSVAFATVLVGLVGVSAALSQLVPFTLISIILSQHNSEGQAAIYRVAASTRDPAHAHGLLAEKSSTGYVTQPGIVMGIHNMSIAAPQLVAAVGSGAVFWLLGDGGDGDNGHGDGGNDSRSTGWVLRAGGLAALGAIWMTMKLRDTCDRTEDPEEDGYFVDDLIPELDLGMDL